MKPKYPVYIISKNRFENCLTAKCFSEDKLNFFLVVEPQEAEEYIKRYPKAKVLILPFSNLGLGSIPARNFVWEHSKKAGHKRHWIFDDNIRNVSRLYQGIRIPCNANIALHISEQFVDQYENVAVAGLNYHMFVPPEAGKGYPPFRLNVHVYSALLILNELPNRWRGRYNEDTDLCLQVLADGFCTIQFQAFIINKMATMTMKGGNTDVLYQDDGRLRMAKALQRLWPGVVQIKRRFKRPQHVVNWNKFDTPLKRKPGAKRKVFSEDLFQLVVKGDLSGTELESLVKNHGKKKCSGTRPTKKTNQVKDSRGQSRPKRTRPVKRANAKG